jgi:hypothetical protein
VDVIDRFADEFWPEFHSGLGKKGGMMLAALAIGRPLTDIVGLRTIEAFERQIVTAFLLGSDFFQSGASLERKVSWVGLGGACPNPFRRT